MEQQRKKALWRERKNSRRRQEDFQINLWGRVMNKNFIRITDNKGVEHTFYNLTSLFEYIDSFTMSFLPDDFTYFIQEENDDR